MRNILFGLISAFGILAVSLPGKYSHQQVIRFQIKTESELHILKSLQAKLNLDVWTHIQVGSVDIRVKPNELKTIRKSLPTVQTEVVIPDIQKLVDDEQAHSLNLETFSTNPDSIFKDYQDAETYLSYLLSLPGTSRITIGITYEKRTVTGVKIGSGPKTVVFNGDGYAYTRSPNGDRYWRKNREPNTNTSCVGTDPNRNFDSAWSQSGASGNQCDDTYYGPSSMSSSEAKMIANYIDSLVNVVNYFDFHSYSSLWMYPYGYSCNKISPDAKDLDAASSLAVAALRSVNGLSFRKGPICKTIYQASGSTADYFYDHSKVKYSMAVELRGNSFNLPASQIVAAGEETLQGILAFWGYVAEH